jgi:ubiquinone biosynthesis protein COQ9
MTSLFTIHVAIQQIQIRMRLLHKLALEMEKPISGVMS